VTGPDPAAEGAEHFNAGRWWEAHEAWEAVWRGATGSERELWRGLILAAAALLHRERGNAHGVLIQGASALERLRTPPPPGFPIAIAPLRAALVRCLQGEGPVPRVEHFRAAATPDTEPKRAIE
jgi:hypothetical protein